MRGVAASLEIDPPEVTLSKLRPMLPYFGIVRLADITRLDRLGVPVAQAIRPNSKSISVHQGKGITLPQALVSAAMEGVESWHAQNQLPASVSATFEQCLSCADVVDPDLLSFTEQSIFDRATTIEWVIGCNLLFNDRKTWVPFQLVHTDYTRPVELIHLPRSSNGLAASTNMTDATNTAICELIERDAIAVWRNLDSQARSRTRLDPNSISEPIFQDLIKRVELLGFSLDVYYLTVDIDVPIFGCCLADMEESGPLMVGSSYGYGCHHSRSVALVKALTEATQTRLTRISGAREDISHETFRRGADQSMIHLINNCLTAQDRTLINYRSIEECKTANMVEVQSWLLDRLERVGVSHVVQIDLSKPEIGIPVVRVVIPGLGKRDPDGRYYPGRRNKVA